MAVSPAFVAHVQDLLAPFAAVSVRRMFGGAGVFRDGLMFALIVADELYLKADAESRPAFEAVGSVPFSYETAKGTHVIGYWSLPPEAEDDPDRLRHWAGLAWEAALRARKPARKPRARHGTRPR